MLLAATLLVAVVAAVGAHNFDSRVYVATDVERALGFGPMTQLPDFHQVSSAVGDEYLLRLAGAIEHICRRSRFKSCLFTGATAGAGATTLATGVRDKLEGMGRKTVLVDASGLTPAVPEAEAVDGTTKNRPSALLQQMADEMDAETIVLTDTAPLLTSGETEYLARFVDSAIVVIQSGLTTRAQLREIAQTLVRLEVPVVGFVLNRVSIEKANPSFRQSIRAVEQRLELQDRLCARGPSQGSSSVEHEREIFQEPIIVTKPEPAKPPVAAQSRVASPEPAAASRSTAAPSATAETERVAVESEAAPATAPRTTRGRGEPVRPEPKISKPVATSPKSAPQLTDPVAATLTPVAASPDARTPPKAPPSPVPPPVNMEPSPDDVPMERAEPRYTTASRLGGLRNLLVSLGRRSLKDAELAGDEPDLEPRFERATIRPAYPDAEAPVGDIDSAATGPSPVRVTAQPEFIRPKTMPEIEKEKESVRPTPPPRRDSKEAQDEIQTLPSWRGQYRKKRYPQI